MSNNINNSVWKKIHLSEAVDYEQPNPYIVSSEILDSGKYPVLTPGKSFVKGYTDEEEGIYTEVPVIIFDDFTTASKYVDFDFKVKSSAMKILKRKNEEVNIKYVFYQMQLIKINASTHKRYYLSKYQHLSFLFPFKDGSIDLEMQNKVVDEIESNFSVIDKIEETISNSLKKTEQLRVSILKKSFNKNLADEEEK